jgi:hypothetical protein
MAAALEDSRRYLDPYSQGKQKSNGTEIPFPILQALATVSFPAILASLPPLHLPTLTVWATLQLQL